ncbi:GATA transcription factor 2 [Senna tora]|uniref:GATA transcription factor n=1 Tax=Senna tora TaxID=362788 RepID=A0A835CIW8_9FABA|nr:GATA transcription factor 2 [Senna tora]
MDMYLSDCFRIDDLLNFPNDDLTTSSSSSTDSHHHPPTLLPPQNPFHHQNSLNNYPSAPSADFTPDLCLPNDDVAELEWLSQFVENCFHDIPSGGSETTTLVGNNTPSALRSDTSFGKAARGKRSSPKPKPKAAEANGGSFLAGEGSGVRRCTHCASEKTPQWRTGPLGPKTLCNACGVRFKSGRLVPEYRPASSPTFVLTQHSNSHRKVMELRRQKEMVMRQQEQQQRQGHPHDYEVC